MNCKIQKMISPALTLPPISGVASCCHDRSATEPYKGSTIRNVSGNLSMAHHHVIHKVPTECCPHNRSVIALALDIIILFYLKGSFIIEIVILITDRNYINEICPLRT